MKKICLAMISWSVIGATVVTSSQVFAASTPERTQQYQSWGAYHYKPSAQSTVCYVLSKPVKELPVTVRHGDNYFLVTNRRESQSSSFEPQLISGYNFKPGSKVTVTVGGSTFSFFTKGNLAWLANPSDETQLVSAMRRGSTLDVKATSTRGTNTNYVYSLSGISAALDSIQKCQ